MFYTCHGCAVALVNGDLSALEDSNDAARIVASIESMGLVTMTETIDPGWHFDCYVCDEVCLGEMVTFEHA